MATSIVSIFKLQNPIFRVWASYVYCQLNPNAPKIKKLKNQEMFDFGGIRVQLWKYSLLASLEIPSEITKKKQL